MTHKKKKTPAAARPTYHIPEDKCAIKPIKVVVNKINMMTNGVNWNNGSTHCRAKLFISSENSKKSDRNIIDSTHGINT